MHMEKKEDKWRKPRSVKGCDRLDRIVCWSIAFVGQLRSLVNCVRWSSEARWRRYDLAMSSVESFFITKNHKDTIHRRNKRPILRYFLTMML
ncbi:hypothetical protein T12_8862, partial [Trichinella patagoniensis]